MSIGERIRYIRNLRGMTQKELGKAIGFDDRTADIRIAQYESGTRTPKANYVEAIAKALNVNEAWLMGYDVPMETKKEPSPISEPPLTEEEEVLLSLFRRVPEDQQQLVLRLIQTALGNQE